MAGIIIINNLCKCFDIKTICRFKKFYLCERNQELQVFYKKMKRLLFKVCTVMEFLFVPTEG